MTGSRERMSSVDTAWLHMERPTNLMMIVGVMMLEERVPLEALRDMLAERFLSYRRFTQKVSEDYSGSYWEDDPRFDVDLHIDRIALPGKADKEELERLVSRLASTPLKRNKPLWQYHLVENYRGGSAVIMRIHHCYADGIALIQVLLSMTDTERVPSPKRTPDTRRVQRDRVNDSLDLGWLYAPAAELVEKSVRTGRWLWQEGLELLTHPGRAVDMAIQGVGMATELTKLTLMPNDPATHLKGPLGTRKEIAWAEPMPLDEVKVVGKTLGCTVNDVLLSCAAGAIGAYLREQGDDINGREIHASVPVNLRSLDDAHELGNYFGLVFLPLPIGIANPLERVFAVNSAMNELKNSHQPIVSLALLAALGFAPSQAQDPVVDLFSRKASAVMSNVPGPQQPLFVCGAHIDQMLFWVPQTGRIGLGVSILSYNGQVQFGLIADRKLVPEPVDIADRFPAEFEKLLLTVLMEPWDEIRESDQVERAVTHWGEATETRPGSD